MGCEVTAEDRSGIGERVRYWFDEDNIDNLIRLDRTIRRTTHPHSAHRKFFQCGFSAILKPTSYWLTKSIKAQRDPNKKPRGVMEAFEDQFALMRRANRENMFPRPSAITRIRDAELPGAQERLGQGGPNRDEPTVRDVPTTTPTSINCRRSGSATRPTTDHCEGTCWGTGTASKGLTRASSGSWEMQPGALTRDMQAENPGHASSIARYFVDLDKAVRRCWNVLEDGGMAVFVIGKHPLQGRQSRQRGTSGNEHGTGRIPRWSVRYRAGCR